MNKMSKNNKMVVAGVVVMTLMLAMGAQGLQRPRLSSLCLIKSVGQFKTYCAEDYLTLVDPKDYLTTSFPYCFPNGIFIGKPLGLNVHLTTLDAVNLYLNLDGPAGLLTNDISTPSSATIERNVNYWYNDITSKNNATSIEECIGWANTIEGAKYVTYDRRSNQCWAKYSDAGWADDTGADSAKLATGTSNPGCYCPGSCSGGVFAKEILVLILNLAFDAFNPSWCASKVPLKQLVINKGPCAGLTLSQVLALANSVIAGEPCPPKLTIDILVDVLAKINLNFRSALDNHFYLSIPKLVALHANLAC